MCERCDRMERHIRAFIRQPIGLNLIPLYEDINEPLPEEYKPYAPGYVTREHNGGVQVMDAGDERLCVERNDDR